MKNFCLCFLVFCFAIQVKSQTTYNAIYYNYISHVKVNIAEIKNDFKPVLQNLEAPVPGGNSYREFLLQQKLKINHRNSTRKNNSATQLGNAESPIILKGFEANEFDGSVPCDNDVAISNNNYLVSVANSTIFMFDINADTLMKKISLEAFSDSLNLPANKYDPKVRYDPIADKFIMVFLSGSESAATNIVVAFSETNNPAGNWFLYALDGNPIQDTVWTDYPIIALSNDELFLTVNLLRDRDPNDTRPDAWKFLFEESIIWQINKNDGYTGNQLQTKVYNNIQFNNRPIRNLCPIQGGSSTYGPNMYLLSNRNFDLVNDTFFILQINNTINNNPQLQIDFRKSSVPYGLAPDGIQASNQFLQTNDSRVLGGYVENNELHFVMNTLNPDTNRAAIYHGVVSNLSTTKNFTGNILGVENLDFAYPNIAYSGKYPGDNEAIITFNHTSVDTAAGFSAVFYNGSNNEYSQRITLKQGDSFVSILNGPNERWGDYSGSQRKYNNPGEIWTAGFFGTRRTYPGSPTPRRVNWSYIAALQSPDTTINPSYVATQKPINYKTFPNPSDNYFTTEFDLLATTTVEITLTNIEGKIIKTIYRDIAQKGKNQFSFSAQPLPTGIYFLNINGKDGLKIIEKIMKE